MRIVMGFLLFAAIAPAQLINSFISGTVQDASGAVMAGVEIVATEQATGVRRNSSTNAAGVYRFVGVEPGAYSIEFSKPGFEPARHENIGLASAQEVVLNQVLSVAGATTSITVDSTTNGVLLAKASPTVDRVIEHDVIEALPLTGSRDVLSLALLAPGVTAQGTGSKDFSANGQRTLMNTLTRDGIDNRDPQFGFFRLSSLPESVSEMKIQTNSFSAEFGRGLGAQVSIVTKGGTNRFHGELWDYYNSNWMSAQTLANKRAGIEDARFTDHKGGLNLGGPIRRDRTFFFVMGDTSPHREGLSANGIPTITIPTPAGFAALANVPLAPAQTQESRRTALSALSFLPQIHEQVRRYDRIVATTINGVPIQFGSTSIGIARPFNDWVVQGRLDHRFTDGDSLTFRGDIGKHFADFASAWVFSNDQFGSRFASSERWINHAYSASYTCLFRSTLVNEARLSFSGHNTDVVAPDDAGQRTVVTSYFNLGPHEFSPFKRPSNTYEAQDVLTWTRGRHSIKFGAHLLKIDDTFTAFKQNQWNFASFASLVNNQATSLNLRLYTTSRGIRSFRQNYFVQDDFKVRTGLTLNIGVRYQRANVPKGMFGAATEEIAAAGVEHDLRPDNNDFAPRFGFAYSPQVKSGPFARLVGDGRTVFRGGFGIGYGLVYEGEAGNLLSLSGNYPWSLQLTLNSAQVLNRFPVGPASFPAAPGFTPTATFTNYPTHSKNPATNFYSYSIQRQIGTRHVVEIGYLGSRSYHMFFYHQSNYSVLTPDQAAKVISTGDTASIPTITQRRIHPQWGSRLLLETVSSSVYNAGYVKFDRRLSRGLVVGANYTYSSSLGNGDGNFDRPQDERNSRLDYGRTLLDRPHRFVVHYVWQTPGKGILSGWRVSGVSQWQSGAPFTVTTGVDSNGDGNAAQDRPNYNPNGRIAHDPVTGAWRSFSTPLKGGIFETPLNANGTPLLYSMPFGGNLGRTTFRGPGLAQWNLSLMKPFRIAERWQLELRTDATNAFNHRNFGPPVASMNSLSFGRNTSSPGSRMMLFGAKIRF